MPKLKPSETEMMNREVLVAIKTGETRRGLKWDTAAKWLGMKAGTYRNRKNDPEKMKLCELRMLVKFAECTDEQILKMIRA